jgi:hypothetical protein
MMIFFRNKMHKNKFILIALLVLLLGLALAWSSMGPKEPEMAKNQEEQVDPNRTYSGNGTVKRVEDMRVIVDVITGVVDETKRDKFTYEERYLNFNPEVVTVMKQSTVAGKMTFTDIGPEGLKAGMQISFSSKSDPQQFDTVYVDKIEVIR